MVAGTNICKVGVAVSVTMTLIRVVRGKVMRWLSTQGYSLLTTENWVVIRLKVK